MKPFILSPLHQIEYSIPDLQSTQRFFKDVFDEKKVEENFSAVLTNPALDIGHSGFGSTVQQFCEPLMEGLPHYDSLRDLGPCVHNLCFLVDSIESVVANCHDARFEKLIQFPLTDIWKSVLDETNIKGNHESCIIATRALFGFQLELAETPWIKEPTPPLMLPAYGPQWKQVGAESGNTLRAINVVVDDLDLTLEALEAVFGDNLRMLQPAQTDDKNGLKSMVVELGRVPLNYHQVLQDASETAARLRKDTPYVHSLVAEVEDIEQVKRNLNSAAIDCAPLNLPALAMPWLIAGESNPLVQANAMDRVGVNFMLAGATPLD